MTLKPDEFIRRFLINVLPNGFHRIRHYGLLASGTKTETIARARQLIAAAKPAQTEQKQQAPDSAAATDKPTQPCPCYGGRMSIIKTFNRGSTPQYRPPPPTAIRIDTSRSRSPRHKFKMPISFAGRRSATAALAQMHVCDLNLCTDLHCTRQILTPAESA